MTHLDKAPADPRAPDWKSALWAGLIAGAVFIVLEMILVPLVGGGSPWGPPRMIAAIVMGPEVLPGPETPPTFSFGIFVVALIVHFVLSLVLAAIFVWVLAKWGLTMAMAVLAGAVFGLVVYVINFYLLTAVFPWFAMARNPITIFAHLVFGAVLAWVYMASAARTRHA